ncbi:MAG: contact-dependent growth inhibition system immunity protein [Rhizobiaceae bacterium]|nr:contact-dependent growth inhibition system immunity protein [Rhizobiaceae bacterium]
MAEEKFEPIEYSPEEIREIRERMSQTVDARDLARRMIEARTRRPDAWADDIAKRFGFDPRQSLTEFEQFDAGDGHDVADEPEVHALRHVPMNHWTPNDVCLMLAYGIGVECALWLALDILSREPMIEARHFEGDLLLVAAQTLASGEAKEIGDADRATALLRAALDDAHRGIWARFCRAGRRAGIERCGTRGAPHAPQPGVRCPGTRAVPRHRTAFEPPCGSLVYAGRAAGSRRRGGGNGLCLLQAAPGA